MLLKVKLSNLLLLGNMDVIMVMNKIYSINIHPLSDVLTTLLASSVSSSVESVLDI